MTRESVSLSRHRAEAGTCRGEHRPMCRKEPDVEIQTEQATIKGPWDLFTGDVWFDVVVRDQDYPRMRANTVRFSPCARTAWHSHLGGQTLYVLEGRGLV